MYGNLVVVCSDTIIFSKAIQKPNGLPIYVGWDDLIDPHLGKLTIPLGNENLFLINSFITPCDKEDFGVEKGPLAVNVVHNGAYEIYNDDQIKSISIPLSKTSFYCRANSTSLESAATTAYLLYKNDPVRIYREAFKACSINTQHFYKGKILTIGRYLKKLKEQTTTLSELLVDENSNKSKIKTTVKYLKELESDHENKMELETLIN